MAATGANATIRLAGPAGTVEISNDRRFTLIAGPCALESRDHAMFMARELKALGELHGLQVIYKTSFDKANRTSATSARGVGLEAAMPVFEAVRSEVGLPVLTDVHTEAQCAVAGEVVDVLQIPAFLCRQTDLLLAAAATGRVVNIKKGQFLAPWDMQNVVAKVTGAGNPNVMATERGASFGYNTLVTDFRGIPTMKEQCGCPVVFDATHSVQQPGGQGGTSGGQREFVPVLARAAISLGIGAVFMETHQDPATAPSDGPNMVPLHRMDGLLADLVAFDDLAKTRPVKLMR